MKRLILAALLVWQLDAVELQPRTTEAFDRYIAQAERRLDARPGFLWADESPDRVSLLRQGKIVVQPVGGAPDTPVAGGLVHDWVGTIFVPGVTLQKTIAVMQDYDHTEAYRPDVMTSRILARKGNDFRVYMRLLKKKVITVVLDTEHDVHYYEVSPSQWRSVSRTTRISEVEKPGKADEKALPPGTGQGFLWKLNSYWRFEERDGGTWLECEAISLTRDVPTGLGWLINPIIQDLPKESLEHTLQQARVALTK